MKSFTTLATACLYVSYASAQLLAGQTNQISNVESLTSCIVATSNADGASVVFSACPNVTTANSWVITGGGVNNGNIQIFGNKCLDVKDGVNADGTHLQIWTCFNGNTNQQFKVNGQQISWVGTNKCLDLTNGNQADGTPIQVWTCDKTNNNNNQKWNEKGLNSPKSLQIEWASKTNLCVTGASNAVNASVVIDSCASPRAGSNNTWHFIPTDDGFNQVATYDNLCMSAPAGISDGGKIVLLPCAGTADQQWGVNTGPINSGLFAKQCLDLTDGISTIGNQFQTWGCGFATAAGDNKNQDFVVKFKF